MEEKIIDCTQIHTKEDLHRIFREVLCFPEYYGCNLDALHDCLTALSEDTRLTLLHWEAAEKSLGRYAATLKRVLAHSEAENRNLHIQFA